MDSILDSTKKLLGIESEYTAFDTDIVMYINAVLSNLNQMGIGPIDGFSIEDSGPTWKDFIGEDPRYNSVKTYVYLSIRMLFDPPDGRFAITAITEQIKELEWRLNILRESSSTLLVGGHKRITGNLGDEHKIRLSSPAGQTLITANGTYEAEFVSKTGRTTSVVLDTSLSSTGVLILPVVINDGVYTVRSLNPKRTILVLDVSVQ